MPKIRYTPFLKTQTKKTVDRKKQCNEQHVRIARSMIYSRAFRNLNSNALKLLIALKMKFYKEEENGNDFEVAKAYGVKLLGLSSNCEKTIRRSLKELVQNGFLEQTLYTKGGGKNKKSINRFRFSENWKDL